MRENFKRAWNVHLRLRDDKPMMSSKDEMACVILLALACVAGAGTGWVIQQLIL